MGYTEVCWSKGNNHSCFLQWEDKETFTTCPWQWHVLTNEKGCKMEVRSSLRVTIGDTFKPSFLHHPVFWSQYHPVLSLRLQGSWQCYLWKLQGEVFTLALLKEKFLPQEPPCSQEPLRKNFNSLKYFQKMGFLLRRTNTIPLPLFCTEHLFPFHQRLTKYLSISLTKKPQSKPHKETCYNSCTKL